MNFYVTGQEWLDLEGPGVPVRDRSPDEGPGLPVRDRVNLCETPVYRWETDYPEGTKSIDE